MLFANSFLWWWNLERMFIHPSIHPFVFSSVKYLLKVCHTLDTVLDPKDAATHRTQKSVACLHSGEQGRQQTRKRKYTVCCTVVSTAMKKKAGKVVGAYTRDIHP